MALELRRFTRAPLGVSLFFEIRDDPEPELVEAIGRDVSLAGMFVETSAPAAFGAAVIVHVMLPGSGAESRIAARVRWTTPEGMGLQFRSLDARETLVITELVRQHEEDQARVGVVCTD